MQSSSQRKAPSYESALINIEIRTSVSSPQGRPPKPNLIHSNLHPVSGKDCATLQHMHQLSHVAWPMVLVELCDRLSRQPFPRHLLSHLFQKMLSQQSQVLHSLSQRRHLDRKHRQPMIKV